jgi:hypothetical protein
MSGIMGDVHILAFMIGIIIIALAVGSQTAIWIGFCIVGSGIIAIVLLDIIINLLTSS